VPLINRPEPDRSCLSLLGRSRRSPRQSGRRWLQPHGQDALIVRVSANEITRLRTLRRGGALHRRPSIVSPTQPQGLWNRHQHASRNRRCRLGRQGQRHAGHRSTEERIAKTKGMHTTWVGVGGAFRGYLGLAMRLRLKNRDPASSARPVTAPPRTAHAQIIRYRV